MKVLIIKSDDAWLYRHRYFCELPLFDLKLRWKLADELETDYCLCFTSKSNNPIFPTEIGEIGFNLTNKRWSQVINDHLST